MGSMRTWVYCTDETLRGRLEAILAARHISTDTMRDVGELFEHMENDINPGLVIVDAQGSDGQREQKRNLIDAIAEQDFDTQILLVTDKPDDTRESWDFKVDGVIGVTSADVEIDTAIMKLLPYAQITTAYTFTSELELLLSINTSLGCLADRVYVKDGASLFEAMLNAGHVPNVVIIDTFLAEEERRRIVQILEDRHLRTPVIRLEEEAIWNEEVIDGRWAVLPRKLSSGILMDAITLLLRQVPQEEPE